MTRRLLISCCALAILASAPTAPARADLVKWTYSWSNSPLVPATTGSGAIHLTDESTVTVVGDSDASATNLFTTADSPATFVNAPFELSMLLTDTSSGASTTLTFTGVFNGKLTPFSSQILPPTFTSLETQMVTLGTNEYTVTIGPYAPPGPPTASRYGSIGASVSIRELEDSTGFPDGGPAKVPEPSSLVLAGLGCSALLGWRFRRRRRAALPPL